MDFRLIKVNFITYILVTCAFFLTGCVNTQVETSKPAKVETIKPAKKESPKSQAYYVTASSLNVRLAPNIYGKKTNVLDKGQRIDVYEIKYEWARISEYYNGSLEGMEGQVARWVSSKYLSRTKPVEKKSSIRLSYTEQAISGSDDFYAHKSVFLAATEKLISQGTCDLSDFKDFGGWVRSVSQKPRKVYFIFCGGYHNSNRIYLDVSNGSLYR